MNLSVNNLLREGFSQAAFRAFPELLPLQEELSIQITESQFADYQCNSAMRWAKALKMPPQKVAEKFLEHLPQETQKILERTQIAGAGFINLWLTASFQEERLKLLLQDPHCNIPQPKPEKIVIDFSSPNVAKEMHVGHLRSTIIGDCLAHLFEFFGHQVLRLNHIGDWGTAFGMLIAYIKEEKKLLDQARLADLMEWYRSSKARFDEDADFKKRSQQEVVSLQGGNVESLAIWKKISDISRIAYEEVYQLLNVHLVERGESFYQPLLAKIVADLEEKGIATLSDGAKCVFIEGFNFPLILQKSDGGYTYDTTDMAALWHRIEEEKAERIIYVTDNGQQSHFQLCFACAKAAGYLKEKTRLDHVPFGLVLGPDGKKFKTRSGTTEKLIDLLNNGIAQAYTLLKERNHTEEECHPMAKILGINAIKYADLACQRTQDYVFSYERMLRFEGNTAAFLMYAYVRILGIQRKVNRDPSKIPLSQLKLTHPTELALSLHLLRFQECLETLAEDLMPHRLADYLYKLAEQFHAFFRDCRVEGSLEESSRLLLLQATAKVLKQGLTILGLQLLDKM